MSDSDSRRPSPAKKLLKNFLLLAGGLVVAYLVTTYLF